MSRTFVQHLIRSSVNPELHYGKDKQWNKTELIGTLLSREIITALIIDVANTLIMKLQ